MNPLKKLAGQTLVYGLSTIVPKFLNYLLVPLYTWHFALAQYGVVTDLYAYVVILNILLTYGMETAFFRFSKKVHSVDNLYSTVFISIVSTSALFAFVTLFFSKNIAAAIEYSANPEYIWIFGLIISIDTVTAIPFVKLRHDNRALRFAFFKLLSVLVNVVLNLIYIVLFPYLVSKGYAFDTYVYNPAIGVGYIFISNLVASALTLLLLVKDMRINFSFDSALLKSMLRYAAPLLLAGLAGGINDTLDRVSMKYLLPHSVIAMEQLGIYGANIKIAVILILFVQTFRFAAEPFFFNYEKEHDSRIVFSHVMNYFVLFCSVIVVLTNVNIHVVKHFIGPEYWPGLQIVPIVLFSNLFFGIYVSLSIWYKLSGKTMFGAYIVGIGALVTILINIVFVPRFGYIACAWARFVCYLVMMFVCYSYGQKYYRIPYQLGKILFYIGAALSIVSLYYILNFYFSNVVSLLLGNFLILLFLVYVFRKEHYIAIFLKSFKR